VPRWIAVSSACKPMMLSPRVRPKPLRIAVVFNFAVATLSACPFQFMVLCEISLNFISGWFSIPLILADLPDAEKPSKTEAAWIKTIELPPEQSRIALMSSSLLPAVPPLGSIRERAGTDLGNACRPGSVPPN
jgi:hypothetical protein